MSSYQLSRALYQQKDRYIDLKTNGRLFPTWVLANFRDYMLPDIIKKPGEDPCNKKDGDKVAKRELRKYQVFLSAYLDFRSPYRDLLVYHGLGSGKTAATINIYNILYNFTPGWNVFILVKASLRGSWMAELKRWLQRDEFEFRFKNIEFINYDSPFAHRDFADKLKGIDSSKKSMFIIEEVHNFIRNVYSNVTTQKGKRAQTIYDYIIRDKQDNPDTRVVCLSGTPAINSPFELALLFNLLRPGIFPTSENEFNHQFVDGTTGSSINTKNKNLFQRRIMGLVSYYIGSTPDVYARKITENIDVPMSTYHEDLYKFYEEKEDEQGAKARFKGAGSQTYRSYTRQACNFVFPNISQRINGENRPRPGKFRISQREASKLEEGRENLKSEKGGEQLLNISQYKDAMDTYVKSFDQYLFKLNADDQAHNHTIMKDVEIFKEKYGAGSIEKFHNEVEKKSTLYNIMYQCSSKMTNICFNIVASPGPTIVYSNYVHMEGIEILEIYLKYFGFYNWMKTKELKSGKFGITEFHGGIKEFSERYDGMKAYNKISNKDGSQIKVMMISSAGAEGLSLRNVRQIHIMEPHWNEVRITQMIGRGIRQCSHSDLPMDEREVRVFRYRSVRTKTDRITTDQYIESSARSKNNVIESFLEAMREVAIDCQLFKKHNMLVNQYKCFQFEEPSLLDKFVGPAYKENIYDDMRIDNGSNSTRAITKRIKVMKINGVKLLSEPDQEPKYSKPEKYWYYNKSGVVYDEELHFPVGKVGKDMDGLPMKLNKDTYIIDRVIPIPMISSQKSK